MSRRTASPIRLASASQTASQMLGWSAPQWGQVSGNILVHWMVAEHFRQDVKPVIAMAPPPGMGMQRDRAGGVLLLLL